MCFYFKYPLNSLYKNFFGSIIIKVRTKPSEKGKSLGNYETQSQGPAPQLWMVAGCHKGT
ncbi:MAG: hypothetical protein K0S51_2532 [Bacillales bacterium]|jgi:hypothetical protein|nr:hypothetical protein [Bacillales bacterium]